VKGLAALEVQWRLKAELGEGDEGLIRRWVCGYIHPGDLGRGPDAQAAAFSLEPVLERHVEAVELDAGMEVLLKGIDDARADERFGAMKQKRGDAGKHNEDEDDRRADQFETPVPGQNGGGCSSQK
jgi:hypothetical protein